MHEHPTVSLELFNRPDDFFIAIERAKILRVKTPDEKYETTQEANAEEI